MAKHYCENCRKGTYKKPIPETFKTMSLLIFTGGGCLGALIGGPVGALVCAIIVGVPVWLVWALFWGIFFDEGDACGECNTKYR